jgi:hypothetical protein
MPTPKTETKEQKNITVADATTANAYCVALLLEREHTDLDIVALVLLAFPEAKYDKRAVITARRHINLGHFKKAKVSEPLVQIPGEGETVCQICGRLLTDPESVAREIGPECLGKTASK